VSAPLETIAVEPVRRILEAGFENPLFFLNLRDIFLDMFSDIFRDII